MRVLQWNILYKEDINNIVKELKRIDADVVCIQELSFTDDEDEKINLLNSVYPYVYYEIADTLSDNRSQGNAILSKYPFIKCEKTFVQEPSTDKNDYSKEGRVYLEVTILYNNKVYNIGTTHLSYTDRFIETSLKDIEVNKLIETIKNKNNYIFTGDLNTIKSSKYIKEIEKYYTNHDTSNTWTTKPFSYNGFIVDKLDYKLDYVFTSSDIIVKKVEVINTEYSDHLPILCEID